MWWLNYIDDEERPTVKGRTLQEVASTHVRYKREHWIQEKVADFLYRRTPTGTYPTNAQCERYEAKLRGAR